LGSVAEDVFTYDTQPSLWDSYCTGTLSILLFSLLPSLPLIYYYQVIMEEMAILFTAMDEHVNKV
jgi:hypothetical protein